MFHTSLYAYVKVYFKSGIGNGRAVMVLGGSGSGGTLSLHHYFVRTMQLPLCRGEAAEGALVEESIN